MKFADMHQGVLFMNDANTNQAAALTEWCVLRDWSIDDAVRVLPKWAGRQAGE